MSRITHCEVALKNTYNNISDTHMKHQLIKNECEKGNKGGCEEALELLTKCKPWSIFDWLLTPGPGVFGLVGGWANITGVLLIVILTIMIVCSLPFVRVNGYFEVVLTYYNTIFY